jgi:hypothetical protein
MPVRITAYLIAAAIAGVFLSVLNTSYVQTDDDFWSGWGMVWTSSTVIAIFDLAGVWLIFRFLRWPRTVIGYALAGLLAGLVMVALLGLLMNDILLWEPLELVWGSFSGLVAALCWFATKHALKLEI